MTRPIAVAEGSDVTLICKASNDTKHYHYQWKKGTVLLPTVDNNNDRYSVMKRGRELTINGVTVSDNGHYHCEYNINETKYVPLFEVEVIVKSEL